MPRVVPDQKDKFENDELFKKLSHDSEVRYIGQTDRSLQERRANLIEDCRHKRLEITFVSCGITLQLLFKNVFENLPHPDADSLVLDFNNHKIRMSSGFILNGVCVIFKGWLDTNLLEGLGRIEFDYETARVEDVLLQHQHEQQFWRFNSVVQTPRNNLERQFLPFEFQSPDSFYHIGPFQLLRDSQLQAPPEIPIHIPRQNLSLASSENEPTSNIIIDTFARASPTSSIFHHASSPPLPSSSPPPPHSTSSSSSSVPVDMQYKQHWKKRIRPNSEPTISRTEQLPHANIGPSKSLPTETNEKLFLEVGPFFKSDQETTEPALDLSMSSKTHRPESLSFEKRTIKNDNSLKMLTNQLSLPLSAIEESPPLMETSTSHETDTTQSQWQAKQHATEFSYFFPSNRFHFSQEHNQFHTLPTYTGHKNGITSQQHRRQSTPDELTVNASLMSLQYHERLNVWQSSTKSDLAGQKGN